MLAPHRLTRIITTQARGTFPRSNHALSSTFANPLSTLGGRDKDDDDDHDSTANGEDPRTKQKLYLQFTCTYGGDCVQPDEEARIVRKMISKIAYEKGVTLVRCPCNKLHLVADRLGWFSEDHTSQTDIVKILEEKGESLKLASPDYLTSTSSGAGKNKRKTNDLVDIT